MKISIFIITLTVLISGTLSLKDDGWKQCIWNNLNEGVEGDNYGIWDVLKQGVTNILLKYDESGKKIDNQIHEKIIEIKKYVNDLIGKSHKKYENAKNKLSVNLANYKITSNETLNLQKSLENSANKKVYYTELQNLMQKQKEQCEETFNYTRENFKTTVKKISGIQKQIVDIEDTASKRCSNLLENEISNFQYEVKNKLKNTKVLETKLLNLIDKTRNKIKNIRVPQMINIRKSAITRKLKHICFEMDRNSEQINLKMSLNLMQIKSNIKNILFQYEMQLFSLNLKNNLHFENIIRILKMKKNTIKNYINQNDKLSCLRVKRITENGNVTLGPDEHVPYFGKLPEEYSFSLQIINSYESIKCHGTKPDGSMYARQVEKTIVDGVENIIETFWDNEENLISKKKYIFTYILGSI